MVITGSAQHGQSTRRKLKLDDGFEYFKSEWLESGQDPRLSPTMFLIEQGPHSTLRAHFHLQNEFQLVVQGDGKFGSHSVQAITVHYAGAYTGYGPIIAGAEGLSYFTIRSVFEQGAVMMPEGRGLMVRGPKRQLHSQPFPPASAAALAQRKDTEWVDIFSPQPDHVAATRLLLPPDGTIIAPSNTGSSGQYIIPVAGSLWHDGREVTRWDPIFVSADEPPLPLLAGAGGADVLCLRLAIQAPEYAAAV
ncbi:hypothetical protein H0A66_04045 [Alcaligenaceae bacterium]|nr:hypothetical protein [Alcaligenaceae bacterium]